MKLFEEPAIELLKFTTEDVLSFPVLKMSANGMISN